MTLRDYIKAKKLIRANRKSNVKLNQTVDVSNTDYAKNKELEKANKAHANLNKRKLFKIKTK